MFLPPFPSSPTSSETSKPWQFSLVFQRWCWCCDPSGMARGLACMRWDNRCGLIWAAFEQVFYPALVSVTGKKMNQTVGQDVSARINVSQQCLLPWADHENQLLRPLLTSPFYFSQYFPYLPLYGSTPCKHTQNYITIIFSVPFKDFLYHEMWFRAKLVGTCGLSPTESCS